MLKETIFNFHPEYGSPLLCVKLIRKTIIEHNAIVPYPNNTFMKNTFGLVFVIKIWHNYALDRFCLNVSGEQRKICICPESTRKTRLKKRFL